MLLKLFLAFTLIPVIELYLLIQLGTTIGPFYTVMLVNRLQKRCLTR